MALQTNLISNCSSVTVKVTDTMLGASTGDTIRLIDYSGTYSTVTQTVTGVPVGGYMNVVMTIPGNGVYTIEFLQNAGSGATAVDAVGVVAGCDIDCCLASMAEELMGCSCDCPKCSATMARATKILLLLNSASTDAGLYDLANVGYIKGAYDKYLKAKEMCDSTCGCDC